MKRLNSTSYKVIKNLISDTVYKKKIKFNKSLKIKKKKN